MPMIWGGVLLALVLLVLPVLVGNMVDGRELKMNHLLYRFVSGQMILWAGFLAICVPAVLKQKPYSFVQKYYVIYLIVMSLLGAVAWLFHTIKKTKKSVAVPVEQKRTTGYYLLWAAFFASVLIQLVMCVLLAYEEGDDAFYIAESTITEGSDTMYRILAYTGFSTDLQARYALAPFPIWITFLAKISGIRAVVVAHVILPMVLIVMSYCVYYMLGETLLLKKKENLPFFMLIVSVMILFGGYSVYTAENFLLVRTAQGKAVLADIIIPFLFLLLYSFMEQVSGEWKNQHGLWAVIGVTMVAGCLCSTQGSFLTCLLVGIVGACILFVYKKWKPVFMLFTCVIIPAGIAGLYFYLP